MMLQVVDLTDELPVHATLRYGLRPLGDIRYLVIHHVGKEFESILSEKARVWNTAIYHINRGYPGISYAFVITREGTIYQTNKLETMSYHVSGRNYECLGICLEGNLSNHFPSIEQLASVAELCHELEAQLLGVEVKGHCEIALPSSPTSCPGELWGQWRWF